MPYGPGSNALVTNALPPDGDTVEEAINKLDAQLEGVYAGLNAIEAQMGTLHKIMTTEPTTGQVAEGQIVFVVEE